LTSRWLSVFFVRIAEDQLQFTPDMKKLFTLSMLISFAMICSCQKQDSAAEQQLAQRKAELDAREKALDEREKAITNIRRIPADVQRRAPAVVQRPTPDASRLKAERDRRMQQLPPEVQRLIPDQSQVQAVEAERAEKNRRLQERLAEKKHSLEELQRTEPSGAAAPPGAEATVTTPEQLEEMRADAAKKDAMNAAAAAEANKDAMSAAAAAPDVEATSPSPSPTPQ